MSLYEPYYYPYYSAKVDLPRSYLQLNDKLLQIKQQEHIRNLERQAYLRNSNYLKMSEYDDINRNIIRQQCIQREISEKAVIDEIQILNNIKRKQQLYRQKAYEDNLNRMKSQAQLADTINRSKLAYLYNNQSEYLTDDQLIRLYQSGIKKQQIQREMAGKRHSGPLYNEKDLDKTVKNNQKMNISALEQKANVGTKNQQAKIGRINSQRVTNSKKAANNKGEGNKRSFFDDLKDSTNMDRSLNKQIKGKTIDFVRQKISPFNIKGANKNSKKRDYSRNSRTNSRAHSRNQIKVINRTLNKTFKEQKQNADLMNLSYVCPENIKSQAIQKINNRLKVSQIVYKDSKIRTARHEINHLFNTFENESKGRRQIKNKINNHPDILKKHLLIPQSR